MPGTDGVEFLQKIPKKNSACCCSEETKPVDFVWDRIVLLLAALAVSLGVIDAVADFFRESKIHCTTKSGQLTGDQVDYANGYCYGFLPWHNRSEFLVVFLVVQSTLVAGVHLMWSEFVDGHVRFLSNSVDQLDRARDPKTGKYKQRNVEIVKLVRRRFEGQRFCSLTYVIKLFVQIVVYVTFTVLLLHFFSSLNKSSNFECPEGFNTTQLNRLQRHAEWALSVSVTCYHTSLSTLIIVKWANVVISCINVLILLYGIASFFLPRQSLKVDYCNMVKFALETGLHPHHYLYHRGCIAHVHCLGWWDDLKFLTLRLLMESAHKGFLLRKSIVQMEMAPKSKSEKESCHCSPCTQGTTLESLLKKLHDSEYACDGGKVVPAQQYKKIFPDAEASVLGVMFGSTSMAHVLYHSLKPSRNKSASCYFINFDFHLTEDSEPVKEWIAPGHQDILLLPVTGKTWKKKLQEEKQFFQHCSSTNLVVIGPLLNYEHCDIVNDLLQLLLNDAGATGTGQSSGATGTGQSSGANGMGQTSGANGTGQTSGATGMGQTSGATGTGQSSGANGTGQTSGATGTGQTSGATGTGQSSGAKGTEQPREMVVLTIFPLKIGGNKVSQSFIRYYGDYTSCKQLKGINKIRFDVSGKKKEWTGAVKHKVTSADVDYEFEFTFYSAEKKVQ